ncbi:hypothetical protein ACHAPA_003005 [Fusarium lateritium]
MDSGLISFDKCETIVRSEDPVYVTTFLRDLRRHIDATGRHTILYAGYLRALQLYGNENAFELAPKERLNFENCRNLEICRAAARNDGYNPSDGRTSPWMGVYFSTQYIRTYPGPLGTFLTTVGEASSSTPESSNSDKYSQENLIDLRTSDSSLSTILHSKKPVTLRGMSGSRVVERSDFGNTCVGGMEMAFVVTELLERVVEGDLSDEWKVAIRETLHYIGGSQNMGEFLDLMYERFPKQEEISVVTTVGRRLRGIGPDIL